MARAVVSAEDEELEPLVDKTEALRLTSKRTERMKKKQQQKRAALKAHHVQTILDLPYELIMYIMELLKPSDIFALSRTCKALGTFIQTEETTIAKHIIKYRYACLEKCFRLPALLSEVDPTIHPLLQSDERQEILAIHKKPYQHIKPPDPSLICTCPTCMLHWNSLCLIVDFAHWQPNLETGQPIPMIPRGAYPEWNTSLISLNAVTVTKALSSPLWYSRILEAHLSSMVKSIRRHGRNKGNKRKRFLMSSADAVSGTDLFLERSGPPTLDFPFHRDNYYMLEAYLPNRGWNGEKGRWMYMPKEQHDRDVENVVRWGERRKQRAREQRQMRS